MRALILAGGRGARLRPLTESLPKPLLPFANVPLARHTICLLQQQGINDFVFLLHYLPEKFPLLLGNGSDLGCNISYVTIPQDLDTAGCVKFVEESIGQTTLICSGDIIVDFELNEMLRWHRQHRAQITIAIRTEELPFGFGVVQANADGSIVRFLEKPTPAELFSNRISCGVYLLEPDALKDFSASRPLSFEREVFPYFAERRKAISGWPLAGYWCDIGQPADYLKAHADFLAGKLPAVYSRSPRQAGSAVDAGGNLVGRQVVLHSSCELDRCVVGNGCIIEPEARIQDAVLWDGVRVGRGARLRECVVGSGVQIGAGAEIQSLALLAAGCEVPPAACVGPQARVGGIAHDLTDGALLQAAVA